MQKNGMGSIKIFLMQMLVMAFAITGLNADITGTVFRDLPVNGTTLNTYGTQDANEVGIAGITVTAYDDAGTAVAVTTAADGSYSLPTAVGAYRVEFSAWPTYLQESVEAGSQNTSVQFVSDGATADLGLHNPADYSSTTTPDVATTHFVAGAYNKNTNKKQNVLITFPYDASGQNPAMTTEGKKSKMGSVWGIAYSKTDKKLYTSAFLKRHSGLGPDGLGAIYRTDVDGAGDASLFVTIPNVGTIPDDATREITTLKHHSHDDEAFGKIGKVGLGDIDISGDDKTLYVTNLNDKNLYVVDIATGGITNYPVPDPGCANGAFRPFATKYHDGTVYVGGVCDGATGDINDTRAYVYPFDPVALTFGASVLDFPLNYLHPSVKTGDHHNGVAGETMEAHASKWHIWTDTYSDAIYNPRILNGKYHISHPVPMLTDIEFQSDGTMLVGLADRTGHQLGAGNNLPTYTGNHIANAYAGGDILRATPNGAGWTIESHVTDGGGDNSTPEFFTGDELNSTKHTETSNGGIAHLPGSDRLFLTAMDPTIYDTGGVRKLNLTDGTQIEALEVYHGIISTGAGGEYGKASGMGDLELLTDLAPVEIGNRVWLDTDGDGVQDAGEAGITGIIVELYDATGVTLLATATTDANGNYIFSSDAAGTTTASHKYGIAGLNPNTEYIVRIPNVSGGSKQGNC